MLRFDNRGRASVVATLDEPAESIALGRAGSLFDNLLLVGTERSGKLIAIDTRTLQQATIASGGAPRIETLEILTDGRVFVTKGNQIDLLQPIVAPRVIATSPIAGDGVVPIVNVASVTFDVAVKNSDRNDPASASNPANYQLVNQATGENIPIARVEYDSATRTSQLLFETLAPSGYELRVSRRIESEQGLAMGGDGFRLPFLVMDDVSATADVRFTNPRINRSNGTLLVDMTVHNRANFDIAGPIRISFDTWTTLPSRSVSLGRAMRRRSVLLPAAFPTLKYLAPVP